MRPNNDPYGNRIYIQHPDKSHTLYAHLDKVLVEENEKVKSGTKIGVMGNTAGKGETLKHLHVSYYPPGTPDFRPASTADPTEFIDAGSRPANTTVSNKYGSSEKHDSLDTHEGVDYSGQESNLIEGWEYF